MDTTLAPESFFSLDPERRPPAHVLRVMERLPPRVQEIVERVHRQEQRNSHHEAVLTRRARMSRELEIEEVALSDRRHADPALIVRQESWFIFDRPGRCFGDLTDAEADAHRALRDAFAAEADRLGLRWLEAKDFESVYLERLSPGACS